MSHVARTNRAASAPFSFTINRQLRDTGDDILHLQQYLNTHGFTVAQSGPGSPGMETTRFGLLTYAALIKFQQAHAAKILTQVGLTSGSGYFGPATRAFVNNK
jgi:peptidoglycan hydrolase-like protein with peptidoglycan-binding domain